MAKNDQFVSDVPTEEIARVAALHNGDLHATAAYLGLTYNAVYHRLRYYGKMPGTSPRYESRAYRTAAAMAKYEGDIDRAAAELQITPGTIKMHLKHLGLEKRWTIRRNAARANGSAAFTQPITVLVTPQVKGKVRTQAREHGVSVSAYVRGLLDGHFTNNAR